MSTQTPNQQPALEKFSEGMGKLRTAALLLIIASIIASIIVIAALAIGFEALLDLMSKYLPFGQPPSPSDLGLSVLGMIMAPLVGLAVGILASLVLGLVAVYAYLLPAASRFAEFDRDRYGSVSTLLRVGYLGGPLALIAGIAVLVAGLIGRLPGFVVVGAVIAFIGVILPIIGFTGLIIMVFRLKDDTGDSAFLAAGILFILGIILGLLDFFAWILVYVAAKPGARPVRGPAYRGAAELPPPPA